MTAIKPAFNEQVTLIEELRRQHKSAQFIASKREQLEHLKNTVLNVASFMNIQGVLAAKSASAGFAATFDLIYDFCRAHQSKLEHIENFANIKRVAIKPESTPRFAVQRLLNNVWTIEYKQLSDHEVEILRRHTGITRGQESELPRFQSIHDESLNITELELYMPSFGEHTSFNRRELTGRYRVSNPQPMSGYNAA